MTTTPARSPNASLPLGVPSSPRSDKPVVVTLEFSAPGPLPVPNTVSLDDLITEFEQDPAFARQLGEARKTVGEALYGDAAPTLSSLRLAAGLSQAQLARRCATSQSHIARIELGQNDPGTDLVARIAAALGKDAVTVFQAVRHERVSRGATQ